MNADELQALSEKMGKPKGFYSKYSAEQWGYPLGLCPKCGEPITFHFTNGGKLSRPRTLRAEHAFTGNVRCEDDATLESIKGMTGKQKIDFFAERHDRETVAAIGLSKEGADEILAGMGYAPK